MVDWWGWRVGNGDRRSETLGDNITSTSLGWSRGLSSYEIKSLILISHCRLACNCLGSRRLPALCSLAVRTRRWFGQVWLRFAWLQSWIIAFSTVKIEVNWFNSQVFCFFFVFFFNSGWLESPSLCNLFKNTASPKALLNNHRCHVAAWMSAFLHLVAFVSDKFKFRTKVTTAVAFTH